MAAAEVIEMSSTTKSVGGKTAKLASYTKLLSACCKLFPRFTAWTVGMVVLWVIALALLVVMPSDDDWY